MTRPSWPRLAVLWSAFLAVHVLDAWLGWAYPSQPMGDVVLVYEPWSTAALSGGAVVGITEPWVYPQLALVPMLLAKALSAPLIPALGASSAYLIAWPVLVTIVDAVAFGILIGRGASAPRRAAGWFWITALLLLGPIALYRIDAITVPLSLVGGLWLVQRPAVGVAVLTIGAWMKIWPGALVLAAVVAARRRWRMLVTAALTAVTVVVLLFLLGADRHLFGFLGEQTGRGLQIESVAATPFLWLVRTGAASIDYSFDVLTFQIGAPAAHVLAVLLTPLMAVAVVAVTVLAAVKAFRGAAFPRLFPPLALTLVVVLIVLNKVGSPQFQTWLVVPILLWIVLDRSRALVPGAIVLTLCLLTCLVYPLTYDGLLRADPLAVSILSARNLLLVVLLATGIRALVRVPTRRHAPTGSTA